MNTRTLTPVATLALSIPLFAHANEEHKLTASDGAAGDFLGRSVSIHHEDIVAGATGHDALGSGAGAAYVWSHDGTDFVEQAKLLASDGSAGDAFGRSVAFGHDTVVVGAVGADAGAVNSGAAYVFVRSGSIWSEEAKLVPSAPVAGGFFGASVAIEEDMVLIGSPGSRSAYVFTRTGTVWTEEAVLSASDATVGNDFGAAVALGEDQAVVGARNQNGTGAAYLYSRSAGIWNEDAKLTALDATPGDQFGAAVALADPQSAGAPAVNVLVGAPRNDEAGLDAGAYYRFYDDGLSWSQKQKRLGLGAGDGLGSSVGSSTKFSIAGSRFTTSEGFAKAGATLLFGIGNPNMLQVFVASDPSAGSLLGGDVSIDDCNIVAGSIGDDALGADAGAVYVFTTVTGFAVLVNGTGVNPVAMTTETPPNIGADWHIEVDTTGFPSANLTAVYVYRKLLTTGVILPKGELLLDLSTQRIRSSFVAGTGVVAHEIAIPNDPFIVGLTAGAQGVLIDTTGGGTVTFTNAERVMIGCHAEHHEE